MATFQIHRDQFPTSLSKSIAMAWLDLVQKAVIRAAVHTIEIGPGWQPTSYNRPWLNRMVTVKDKDASEKDALIAANLGHVIESRFEPLLGGFLKDAAKDPNGKIIAAAARLDPDLSTSGKPGDYMWQKSVPCRGLAPNLFPNDFTRRAKGAAGKATIPDLRVALGGGYEALFDLTSRRQVGHVLLKGGSHLLPTHIDQCLNTWLRPRVAFIAEVFYPEEALDRRSLVYKAELAEIDKLPDRTLGIR